MSEHLPTGAEAHSKFDHAKRQAVVESLVALLRGKPGDLLPFDDVQRKLGLHITRERGLQQVPLDQIVGSAGKYRDFTRSFWPRNEKLRERWKWIYVAAHDFRGLPPVELYQVGEVYFVKDGNHRISVARALGSKTIEAYVTEYISPALLTVATVDADLDALALQIERERFLGRTRLPELRPDAQIELSQPGGYDTLQEHIAVPAYVLSQQTGQPVAWDEAVALWYDDVYTPVVRVIRQHDLLRRYPGRSDADLYLWLMEHRDALDPALEQALAAAARQFVETIGRPQLRWLAEARSEPGAWRAQRVLPRGDGPLFADILLPLDETDAAWQTVERHVAAGRACREPAAWAMERSVAGGLQPGRRAVAAFRSSLPGAWGGLAGARRDWSGRRRSGCDQRRLRSGGAAPGGGRGAAARTSCWARRSRG